MDPLDRLYWRLVQALDGSPAARALSVGELYQRLVPYRAVRSELGLLELAQYEHTLLRLLAGEHGYVRSDDPAVQDELRRELQSPNPILGLYRDYADATLRIAEPRAPAPPAGPSPTGASSPAGRSGAERRPAPARQTVPAQEVAPTPAPAPSRAQPAPAPPTPAASPNAAPAPPRAALGTAAGGVACHGCGAALPRGRAARFCPFCGAAQPAPCPSCGEPMEADWSFCLGCGEPRRRGVPPG